MWRLIFTCNCDCSHGRFGQYKFHCNISEPLFHNRHILIFDHVDVSFFLTGASMGLFKCFMV
ncbi:hypothetical protein Hanom_Chr05g00402301 [Helianthus anomalus]